MPAAAAGQGYFQSSRAPRYSLLFALPLLLGYEGLAIMLPMSETHGVRNGAEVILLQFSQLVGGQWGNVLFGAVVIGVAAWLVARDVTANGAPSRERYFVFMTVESLLLAVVLGATAAAITTRVVAAVRPLMLADTLKLDTPTEFMTSLGAGLFEELLFRVILVTLLLWGAKIVLGLGHRASAVLAVIVSALIFSAFHYIGPYGDKLTLASFVDRAVAGLLLSGIYVTRGFGITAWSHALYDVLVLLVFHK